MSDHDSGNGYFLPDPRRTHGRRLLSRSSRRALWTLLVLATLGASVYTAHTERVHGPGLVGPPPLPSLANELPAHAIRDPASLSAVRSEASRAGSAALVVIRDGKLIAEWGPTDRRIDAHSVRKSLISALYGIAVGRGLVDLSRTLAELGIDDEPPLDERERTARLIDLLASRSGIYRDSVKADQETDRPARGAHEPGSVFWYNNWSFNALGGIFEQLTGSRLGDAFDEWLAQPIGMQDFRPEDVVWIEGSESRFPAWRIRISARDLARFGTLYLDGGRAGGRQVVPDGWIRDSVQPHSTIGDGIGYGYLWWTMPGGAYFATGTGGQKLLVDPARRVVAVHRVDTGEGLGRAVWSLFGPRVSQPRFLGLVERVLTSAGE